ncbi:MAG: zinc ribbon domain-containing protein [Candidatus Thorarchaeota archaeon]
MKTKTCEYCGELLKKSWNSCPNCGTKIPKSTSQELPERNPFQVRFKKPNIQISNQNVQNIKNFHVLDIFSYLALIFSVFGFIFGFGLVIISGRAIGAILEVIFAIFAIIFGAIPLIKREVNYKAYIGLILGVIDFYLFIYFTFMSL